MDCHRLLLSGHAVEAELWVGVNDHLIRKLVATFNDRPGNPQIKIEFSDWNLAAKVTDGQFTYVPPPGAMKIPMRTTSRNGSGPGNHGNQIIYTTYKHHTSTYETIYESDPTLGSGSRPGLLMIIAGVVFCGSQSYAARATTAERRAAGPTARWSPARTAPPRGRNGGVAVPVVTVRRFTAVGPWR